MLATLPATRFQRLGHPARVQLRITRRNQLRALEAAHRDRYPDTLAHLGVLNLHLERQGSAGVDTQGDNTTWALIP